MTILLESAIRVTLIAAIIALVLFAMRIKTASVLHAVWSGVIVVMMLLPAWIAWGPKASLPILPADGTPVVELVPPRSPAGRASTTPAPPVDSLAPSPARGGGGYILIYLLGVGVFLLRLAIGTMRANRLTSSSCVVPVTVGLLHPRIILPECSRDWPQAQLDAVVAHEGEHIRRRDPLFQWIALLNRAIFWFHPLAWWLERRLSGLAEEACDAAVIARGYDPREYSEYLLDLARSVERAGSRINAVGMAMPGIGLNRRIRQMLSDVPVPRISRPRMACAVAVCAGAATILSAATLVHAQSAGAGPKFEVATIKPGRPGGGGGKSKDGGGGGPRSGVDHKRFNYSGTLLGLIAKAYGLNGCGLTGEKENCPLLSGGPAWANTDRFDIQAKMPDDAPEYTFVQFLDGQAPQLQLMLQALLADRFNLKIHRETKQLSVYALTVGKNGPKLKTAAGEMIQSKDGTFTKNRSLLVTFARDPNGDFSQTRMQMLVRNRSIQELVNVLSNVMDRPVLNRTELQGEFDFTIEYERDPDEPGIAGSLGPSMFAAFQEQLGLKFEATKGPVEAIAIDHAEKPSEN